MLLHFRKLVFVLLINSLLLSSAVTASEGKKVWSCKKKFGSTNILWLVEWGEGSYVKVFKERIPATYTMDGLEKRWNWGLTEDLTYNYSISLKADLSASYYNFKSSKDGLAKPSEFYECSSSK